MKKQITLLLLTAAIALPMVMPGPAFAEATTFTQRFHRETIPILDPFNPCAPAIGTGIVNGVVHTTVAGNGSIHFTLTQTGSFDVLDLNSGQNATGHFTVWAGSNVNFTGTGDTRVSETFTLNVNGKTKDGSIVRFNLVGQFREVNGVPTLDFLKANCH